MPCGVMCTPNVMQHVLHCFICGCLQTVYSLSAKATAMPEGNKFITCWHTLCQDASHSMPFHDFKWAVWMPSLSAILPASFSCWDPLCIKR